MPSALHSWFLVHLLALACVGSRSSLHMHGVAGALAMDDVLKDAIADEHVALLQLNARAYRGHWNSSRSTYPRQAFQNNGSASWMSRGFPPNNEGGKDLPHRRWKLRKGARLNEVLVVPHLKLIFCFIPKNACTQFNRLMNALNGIDQVWNGSVCSDRDPNYKSGMPTDFDLEHALNDPSWTKATFLRDPLQRFVSAYQSKCVKPRECGGCMGVEENEFTPRSSAIGAVAGSLEVNHNAHFLPQSSLCGGLADNIGAYDYVGQISHDYNAVATQVLDMLKLVWRRQTIHPSSRQRDDPVGKPEENEATKVKQDRQLYEHLMELGLRHFPSSGPPEGDLRVHSRLNASNDLLDMFTLQKALTYYAEDYDKLPGLTRPAWARRVSAYYDAFELWYPRPKWLSSGKKDA